MASINDFGGLTDPLNAPPLGGPSGWAASVAAVLDGDDTTVNARIEEATAPFATIGNLLTANQASGTDTLGTTAGLAADRCVISSSTASAYTGTRSIYAVQTAATTFYRLRITVTPLAQSLAGTTVTMLASVKSSGAGASNSAMLQFSSNLGNIASPPVDISSAGWTHLSHAFVMPAGVTLGYFEVVVYDDTGKGGAYFDALSFHAGAGGNWAMPGTPITGLGKRVTHPNTDDVLVQQWDDTQGRWQTVHYDSGWRNIASLLDAEWIAGMPARDAAYMRRIGTTCYFQFRGNTTGGNLTGTGNAAKVLTYPTGFKPSEFLQQAGFNAYKHVIGIGAVASVNYMSAYAPVATWQASAVRIEISWSTNDAIPTSLPGTLVTPAPA